MATTEGIETGMRLHAKYGDDGEYYPAVVTDVSSAKKRAKKPVKVKYNGYEDEVWVSVDALKSKKLRGNSAPAPAPKAKAKAKAKAKVKAKAKDKAPEEKKPREPVKFTYFAVWAKGPSIALALELSGIEWVGAHPEDWKGSMKASTPWLELPTLEVPGAGLIGHEAAILNYIGKRSKKMDGYNMTDYLTSQQLMQEGEDVYKRLAQIKGGQLSDEQQKAFWNAEDSTTHNKDFGIKVYLSLLDKFYTKCNAGEGKYTKSGITVGECKLFTMLHACKMCKDDVLNDYAGVKAFYDRFSQLEKTQHVIAGTGKMPGQFKQYFGA